MADDSTTFNPNLWMDEIDAAARAAGHGSVSSALANNYYGYNKFSNRAAFLPINRDVMGYTFFTRPILNLSYDNLLRKEKLYALATNNPDTIPGAIRSMFDAIGTVQRKSYSRLFDNAQAFVPILGNTLESLTGFPDIVVDLFTAAPGARKETWQMIDGQSEFNEAYQLSASFGNVSGDPVTMILDLLQTYGSAVYLGEMVPYWDAIVNNYIDYTMRIYRVVLDQTYRYVTKIGAPYSAICNTNPIGAAFDYATTKDTPLIKANNQISCQWSCVGFRYNTMSLIQDFNSCVTMFNPQMKDGNRTNFYRKLTPQEYAVYNFVGYPRIDLNTNEFEWWVPRDLNLSNPKTTA
jgi:hypothetical protein